MFWESFGSVVAGRTARFRMHRELFLELFAQIQSRGNGTIRAVFFGILVAVVEIIDLLQRTQMLLGCAVAIQAEAHRERLRMVDNFHLVHVTVAALAGNPAVNVCGVVEINVVGSLVNPDPLDGLAIVAGESRIHRTVERSEFGAVLLHVLVAVPTSIPCRHVGMSRNIDKRVTVPTVQTELIDVNFMRERDGLGGLITNELRLRSRVICDRHCHPSPNGTKAENDFERKKVRPAWKNIRHGN